MDDNDDGYVDFAEFYEGIIDMQADIDGVDENTVMDN